MWQALVLSIIYNKELSSSQVVKLLAGGTSKEGHGQFTIWYSKYYQRKHYIKHIKLVAHQPCLHYIIPWTGSIAWMGEGDRRLPRTF